MQMKSVLILLFFLFTFNFAGAQSVRYAISLPYIRLSAYSKQHNHALSFTGNQASLAQIKQAGAGLFGERRFLLKETSAYTLGASLPTRLGNTGLQLNYSGFRNFNEYKIGLAYARQLGKAISVGVQFNYYSYRVPAYGNASALNFEIGAMMHVTDKLNAGVHVYSPVGGKLRKRQALAGAGEEKTAPAYRAGLGYDASDKFFIAAEISKEEDKTVNITAGLHYRFAKQFFAQAGFMSESATVWAGAGVAWKNLRLDISFSHHPQLGFSPGILLIVQRKKIGE